MTETAQTPTAYEEARRAISRGQAEAHALWVVLSDERQRDGYLLKPMPWEGPGEYQRVCFADGRDGFVGLRGWRSLPVAKARAQ